jgi:hypothetical protein
LKMEEWSKRCDICIIKLSELSSTEILRPFEFPKKRKMKKKNYGFESREYSRTSTKM